jgi:hypothetical protein
MVGQQGQGRDEEAHAELCGHGQHRAVRRAGPPEHQDEDRRRPAGQQEKARGLRCAGDGGVRQEQAKQAGQHDPVQYGVPAACAGPAFVEQHDDDRHAHPDARELAEERDQADQNPRTDRPGGVSRREPREPAHERRGQRQAVPVCRRIDELEDTEHDGRHADQGRQHEAAATQEPPEEHGLQERRGYQWIPQAHQVHAEQCEGPRVHEVDGAGM